MIGDDAKPIQSFEQKMWDIPLVEPGVGNRCCDREMAKPWAEQLNVHWRVVNSLPTYGDLGAYMPMLRSVELRLDVKHAAPCRNVVAIPFHTFAFPFVAVRRGCPAAITRSALFQFRRRSCNAITIFAAGRIEVEPIPGRA